MEWAPIGPQLASTVGPHVGYCVDVWAKLGLVSGLFAGYGGMEWAPIGPQLASPVGPHVEYCVDLWGKLGLGFRALCWVWSGPQMGPS